MRKEMHKFKDLIIKIQRKSADDISKLHLQQQQTIHRNQSKKLSVLLTTIRK